MREMLDSSGLRPSDSGEMHRWKMLHRSGGKVRSYRCSNGRMGIVQTVARACGFTVLLQEFRKVRKNQVDEISRLDIQELVNDMHALVLPPGEKIIHVLPQEFVIDGQDGIRHPIGMSGVRLEARVHLITGSDSAAQNISKCVARCGLNIDQLIVEQLASSESVLTEDEKELGICLVDIGAGTTDIEAAGRSPQPRQTKRGHMAQGGHALGSSGQNG